MIARDDVLLAPRSAQYVTLEQSVVLSTLEMVYKDVVTW